MKKMGLVLQVGLIALCLAPVGRQVAADWGEVSAMASQIQAPALVVSGLLLVAASFFLPVAMAAFTRGASERISYRHSAIAYFGSQPMKYLPGSFWILPGRVMLLKGMGHDASLSTAGLLFEMTVQVLSSSLAAAVLLGAAIAASAGAGGTWLAAIAWLPGAAAAGSLAIAGLLLVSPALAQRLAQGARRQSAPAATQGVVRRLAGFSRAAAGLADIPLPTRLRNLALALVAYLAMWLLMGLSFYLVLVAGDPRLDPALLRAAIGVSTLSWLIGFLAPFSPGGIGVREAAIVLLLGALAPGSQATLVALLSRALALAVELAFAAAAWPALRAARKTARISARAAALAARASARARTMWDRHVAPGSQASSLPDPVAAPLSR